MREERVRSERDDRIGWGGRGCGAVAAGGTERGRFAREPRRRKHRRPKAEERSETQATSEPGAFAVFTTVSVPTAVPDHLVAGYQV
ncbi:hypothetical protein GCM10009000_028270 [Halobacterium noricense]